MFDLVITFFDPYTNTFMYSFDNDDENHYHH